MGLIAILSGRTAPAALVLAAGLVAVSGGASADDELRDEADQIVYNLGQMVAKDTLPTLNDREKERLDAVQGLLTKAPDGVERWPNHPPMAPDYLTLRDAALRGLKRNLTLSAGYAVRDQARYALQEAEAIFDPSISVSVNYSDSRTYRRAIIGRTNVKRFKPKQCIDFTGTQFTDSPHVLAICFGQEDGATGRWTEIETSSLGKDPDQAYKVTANIGQQLPWGAYLSLTSTNTVKQEFYKTGHAWDHAMFYSDVGVDLSVPFPFMRGWGEYSAADTALKLADKSREQADWTLKQVINSTLQSVEGAYWDLTQALEELHASTEHFGLIKEQFESTERLFKVQRATEYDFAQMSSEYAKAQSRLETARASFLTASHALGNLIEDDQAENREAVYLTFSYSDSLRDWLSVKLDEVLSTARENRPDLFIQAVARESDVINLRAAEVDARPDLQLAASIDSTTKTGKNSVGEGIPGHSTPLDALGHAFTGPDTLSESYSLTFNRPWGNRALESVVDQRRLSLKSRTHAIRSTGKNAERELRDLVATLDSVRARVRSSEKQYEAAKLAYDGLVRRQDLKGGVSKNELIRTARSRLDAEKSFLAMLFENKRMEAQLLSAEGILSSAFPDRSAITDFERKRVRLLSSAGHLQYFGVEPDHAGEAADDATAATEAAAAPGGVTGAEGTDEVSGLLLHGGSFGGMAR